MSNTSLEIRWAEKIAVLEHKVTDLESQLSDINGKLDQILDLKAKGQGAFWVASAIFGTGIVAVIIPFLNYLKGAF